MKKRATVVINWGKDFIQDTQGVAVAMALYIIVVFLTLGLVMTGVMISFYVSSTQDVAALKAYYIAYGGTEHALNKLKNISDWSSKDSDVYVKNFNSSGTDSFNMEYNHPIEGAWEFNNYILHDLKDEALDYSGRAADDNVSSSPKREARIHGATTERSSSEVISTLYGAALKFNGSSDYVNCGNYNALYLPTQITVEAWVKNDAAFWVFQDGHIVNKGGGWSEDGYSLFWNGTNIRVELQKISTGEKTTCDNSILSCADTSYNIQNEWHHVAFTWSKDSETIKTYIDGNQCSNTCTFGSRIGNTSQNLNIGRNANHGRYFDGWIDSVRIYNDLKGPDEIAYHYNRTMPKPLDAAKSMILYSTGEVQYKTGGSTITATRKIEFHVPMDID